MTKPENVTKIEIFPYRGNEIRKKYYSCIKLKNNNKYQLYKFYEVNINGTNILVKLVHIEHKSIFEINDFHTFSIYNLSYDEFRSLISKYYINLDYNIELFSILIFRDIHFQKKYEFFPGILF